MLEISSRIGTVLDMVAATNASAHARAPSSTHPVSTKTSARRAGRRVRFSDVKEDKNKDGNKDEDSSTDKKSKVWW